MTTLQAGVAKSGNYWIWKIIDLLLLEGGVTNKSFVTSTSFYEGIGNDTVLSHEDQARTDVLDVDPGGYSWRVSSYHREEIRDIAQYVSSCSHIWSHSEYSAKFEQIFTLVDSVVYIIRDPRDVIVSMANFAFTDYVQKAYPHKEKSPEEYMLDRGEWQAKSWKLHVLGWLSSMPENGYVIFYENMKNDLDGEIRRLILHLGLEVDDNSIDKIKSLVSISSMKAKNPDHVRKGSNGGWENDMPVELRDVIWSSCGELLQALGYSKSTKTSGGLAVSQSRDEFLAMYKSGGYSNFELVRAAWDLCFSRRELKDKLRVIRRKVSSLKVFRG